MTKVLWLVLAGLSFVSSNARASTCEAWTKYMVGVFFPTEESPKFEGPFFGYRLTPVDLAPLPEALVKDLKENGRAALAKYRKYDSSRKKYFDAAARLPLSPGNLVVEDTKQTRLLRNKAYTDSGAAWKAMWAYGNQNNCMEYFLVNLQTSWGLGQANQNQPFFEKSLAAQRQISSLQKANQRALLALDECKAGAPAAVAKSITKQVLEIREELEKSCPDCNEAQLLK